jgi:hypothetical protein
MTNVSQPADPAYAAVGRAITQWSWFEAALANIFSTCITPTCAIGASATQTFDGSTPNAIFYSVENFRSRLAMVDAALHSRLGSMRGSEELISRWMKLHNKARAFSAWRNRMAHWNAGFVSGTKGAKSGLLLTPFYSNPSYHRLAKKWCSVEDLHRLIGAFDALTRRAGQLSFDIASLPALHRRFGELVAHQMVNDAHHNQIALEELKRALSWPE